MLNLDYKQAFDNVKNNLISALQDNFPIEGNKQKIIMNKVWVDDNLDALDFNAQKEIKLNKQSWAVPVYADISLVNKFTDKIIDRNKKFKLVNLPKITSRNTHIIDGTEYTVSNQFRLKPGVYTRVKANGELESQVNLARGLNHKIIMNPETGVFNLNIKQANIPLYPIIKALGVSDKEIKDQWGSKILTANQEKVGAVSGVKKLFKSVYNRSAESEDEAIKGVTEFLQKTEMARDTTKLLLGKEFNKVTPKMWLLTSSKILRVNRGEEDPDDRDSLLFKELHSVENFVNERITKGKSRIAGKIRNNIDKYPQLKKIVNIRYFNEPIRELFTTSDLSGVPSQFNPMNMINEQYKATLMGEGGISSPYTVAEEARNIHGSHLGFIDPVYTPDSSKVGLTLHTTIQTIKDGKDIKTLVVNPESGKEIYLNPAGFFGKVVAFPDQYEVVDGKVKFISKNVKVSYQGNIQEMSKDKVDYVLPSTKGIFSYSTNLIPFLASTQGNRAMAGAKMIEQAVSLSDREVPLVQSEATPGESFANMQGRNFAVFAPIPGRVSSIKEGKITIKGKETRTIPYYDNFPLGQNNFINSELNVKVGDEVGKGQILADTNFTKDGTLAIGKNLLTAYVPFKGYNVEDSIVISETAAKKLTSERLYRKEVTLDENSVLKLSLFDAHYPDAINPGVRKKLDSDGVIREGEEVDFGDVLIAHLRLEEKTVEDVLLGRLTRVLYHPYKDRSVSWDLNTKGVVTQVIKRPGFVSVYVKTKEPLVIGDKISPLQGGKGTVGLILPDKDMPKTKEGQSMEVLFNPHGIVSRMIPSQIMEASASKIAESQESPYYIDNFADEDNLAKTKKELAARGLTDQTELIDPESGKSIGKVLVGKNYFMKSFKETKTNLSARAQDGYDIDMQPIRGGHEGAKALDMLTLYSMLSHGAQANLHELGSYKSEKNDEYWRAIELGLPLPPPKQPFVFDKFVANLKTLGVDPVRQGSKMTLFPMTDTKIKEMSHGNIEKGEFIRAKDLKPIKGGLFDPVLTGGMRGQNFTHFDLSEKIPNPLFEQPIKTVLDLSASQYEDLISGDLKVDKDGKINPETGISGGGAFSLLLSKVKVAERINSLKEKAKGKRADQLDKINKELRYLTALETSKMKAEDAYLLNKVLILPPIYRPIYPLPSGDLMPSSLNVLYKHLHGANTKLGELRKLPEIEEKKNLRTDLYKSVKALYGLGPPIASSLRKQELKGIIDFLAGSEPKTGFFQEKVLKKQQDIAGRATIIPGPNLGVNEIGLPEDIAWTMYRPFIMKEMVQQGYKPTEAEKRIEQRDDLAMVALQVVLKERPLLLNRAPSLHKFSIMAFKPKVVAGKSIELPPLVTKGFNADFDGDAVNVFVPVSERATRESFKLLPSKNLFDPGTGKVMLMPSQEAIVGLNLLTQPGKSLSTRYASSSDILKDFKSGRLNIDSMVKLDGKSISPGRIMVNNVLPKKYHDLVINKSTLGKLLSDIGKKDPEKYENLVGKLKNLGDEFSYRSGFSLSLKDFDNLPFRSKILDKAKSDIARIRKSGITDKEKEDKMSDIYSRAAGDMEKEIKKNLPQSTNSLFKMVASGARGTVGQLRQTLAAPIMVQGIEGKNIPVLLDRSFSEGLPLSQYWTSMYGARRGTISGALQTAEPGALGKQVAASVLDNIVTEDDCGTKEGIIFSLNNREALNRYTAEPATKGGRVLANRNDLINTPLIDKLRQSGVTEIKVRSPLTCESKGTCSKCYGLDEFGKPPDIGTNVGIKAGQTISEPLSQGTLNIFHTGGVTATKKGPRGYERINQLLKMPQKVKGKATLAAIGGSVKGIEKAPAGGFDVFVGDKKHFVNPGRELTVKKGDPVSPGDRLSTGAIKPQELVKLKGLRAVQDYLADELHDVYREQDLPIDRKIFETVVRSVTNQSKITSPGDHPTWLPGDYVPYSNVKAWNKKKLQEVDIDEAKGKRLGQDYFQYKKGFEATDEILALLEDRGIKKPLMELKPVTHEPALAGINKLPLLRTDWLTRLGHSRLKNTILEASAKGYTSDIHGLSPIPAYIMGEERKIRKS